MGKLAICRNAETLHAEGGPCPIIAVYRPDAHLGVLLHVNGGDAEVEGDNHEELIDRLLVIEPDVLANAVCHIFLDETPFPGMLEGEEADEQVKARTSYAKRMGAYLAEKGFGNISIVVAGQGKAVELDTEAGIVTSKDDNDEVTFSYTYEVPQPQPGPAAEQSKEPEQNPD